MTTELFTGAEMVVKSLSALKVKYIFGYPGGSVLDIYDAIFQQDEIEHILVRHEQAATHMADGYTRATGEVGVVLATSGPGATNCVTGIATAYMDSIPMVVLAGQVATSLIGNDAFQETDIVGCTRPIIKHSFSCRTLADIPDAISKAFYIASTGRPGPVVVELPKDILIPQNKGPFNIETDIKIRSYNPNIKGHSKQIKKAAQTISNAKRLVVYSGGGIVLSDASELLTKLVETLKAPITNTLMGLGGISGTHKQFIGMLGMHGSLEANKSMANADVILALGALSEVVRRFIYGSEPMSSLMMIFGGIALIANIACLFLIFGNKEDGAHMKASWIFSANDVIANIGVILAGLLVTVTSSRYPDLVIGLIIAFVVLNGARRILQLKY